jgi:hypothetical protein
LPGQRALKRLFGGLVAPRLALAANTRVTAAGLSLALPTATSRQSAALLARKSAALLAGLLRLAATRLAGLLLAAPLFARLRAHVFACVMTHCVLPGNPRFRLARTLRAGTHKINAFRCQ